MRREIGHARSPSSSRAAAAAQKRASRRVPSHAVDSRRDGGRLSRLCFVPISPIVSSLKYLPLWRRNWRRASARGSARAGITRQQRREAKQQKCCPDKLGHQHRRSLQSCADRSERVFPADVVACFVAAVPRTSRCHQWLWISVDMWMRAGPRGRAAAGRFHRNWPRKCGVDLLLRAVGA